MPFVIIAYLSLFVLGLSDNIRGPTFPDLIQFFLISDFESSFFFSLSCLAGIFGSLLAPNSVKKFGEIFTLRATHLLMATAQIGFYFASDFVSVLASAALFGFSLAMMGVCENSLVLHYAPSHRVQRFQAGLHSMYGLSSFVAPLVVTAVYQHKKYWAQPHLAVSLIGLLFTVSLLFVKEKKVVEKTSVNEPAKLNFESLYFALALALYVGAELLISTRLALYSQRQWGSDFTQANQFVSVFFLLLLIGRASFIFWQPNLRPRSLILTCLVLTTLSLLSGFIGWRWGFSLSGLFMAPFYPLMMTTAGRMFPSQIYQFAAYAVGLSNVTVLLMHGAFGKLSDLFGIQVAMWGAVLLTLLSILLILVHPLIFKRSYS